MNYTPRTITQLLLATWLILPAFAQDEATEEDELYDLSPFHVDGADDTGYRAKHTLAGTRLRISLDDVTVPIDVITPEMLEDFNINEQEDLFDIVSNMETRDDSFLSGVYESGASYRIRGFTGVRSLRNFASSNMPFDAYNSTRFIASKGPNSILFGSGPGGGSVSFFTKRYIIGSRDRTRLKFSVDSFGSTRVELTGTKTLIEDKLGIFYGVFDDRREYYVEPSYQDRNGMYLSASYRPFENTLITASYETRSDHVFRPASSVRTLVDYHSAWEGFGNAAVLGTGVNNRRSDLKLPDGTVVENQAWRAWGIEQFGNANNRYTVIDGQIVNLRGAAWTDRPRDTSMTDGQRSFLVWDWPRDLGPTGLNGGAEVNTVAYDFNIEQKLAENLYLMLATGWTDNHRLQFQHRHRQLYKDPNYYLPDGTTLNPHLGEYYIENGNYNFFDRLNDSDTVTATLAYELDLEEKNKYLGVHNFALMHSVEEVFNGNIRQRMILTETPDPDFEMTNVEHARYRLYTRHYLGDDLSVLGEDDMFPDYRFIQRDGRYSLDGYTWTMFEGVGGSGWRNIETTSNLAVMQSNFFRSRLITSLGYREESVDQFLVNFARNPNLNNQYTAYEHYNKEQADDPNYVPVQTDEVRPSTLPSFPWETVEGISRNTGAIFKITPDIALVANAASNISGAAGRVGLFNQALPNSEGESEDIGLRFNLFDNRMRFEYNRYNTAVTNQALQSSRLRLPGGDAQNILKIMIQNGDTRAGSVNVFENGLGWDVRDFRSRGHELSVTGSPIRRLSLRLAVTYNEQVATNIGSVFMAWWNENAAAMESFVNANPDATDAESESATPETAAESWEDAQDLLLQRAGLEGIPNVNQPLWTAKALAKYQFDDGLLRGHATGLNLAWRGKQKSNHFRNADGSYDYERPFYSQETLNANFFWNYSRKIEVASRDVDWRLQLNVYNAFNSDNITSRNFFYSIRGDETSTLLHNQINEKEPRRVSITNTFSF